MAFKVTRQRGGHGPLSPVSTGGYGVASFEDINAPEQPWNLPAAGSIKGGRSPLSGMILSDPMAGLSMHDPLHLGLSTRARKVSEQDDAMRDPFSSLSGPLRDPAYEGIKQALAEHATGGVRQGRPAQPDYFGGGSSFMGRPTEQGMKDARLWFFRRYGYLPGEE